MHLNPKTKSTVLNILLAFCLCGPFMNEVTCQDSTKTTLKEKEKKGLKAIEKLLSFKNFFHHSDSSRLAKRYIRWHKKLTRKNIDYRFTISRDNLNDSLPFLRNNEKELTHEVLGWYPHWEKNLHKNLNYSLLTTVAYFSYEVNPNTGEPIDIHDWADTPVIDSLLKNDKKVLLTITNFGNNNNKKFLKNTAAGNTLIKRVIKLLKDRKAHGVCIDFEGILKSQKNNYNSFIALLSQELKKANKDYLVYLTVPAVNWNKYLDFEVLIPVVDRFVILGYNYYGSTSKVAGPVAPLKSGKLWDPFNLTTSVDYYLANKIPADNLILALPFYGNVWDTKTGKKGSKINNYVGGRTFDYIKYTMDRSPEIKVKYDSISQSSWYSFISKEATNHKKRQFRQIWFEGDSSMTAKMNFIKDRKLRGLGVWALGYDKKYDNYWNLVENIFANPKDGPYPPYPDPYVILKYPDSIVVIIIDTTNTKIPPIDCTDPECLEKLKKAEAAAAKAKAEAEAKVASLWKKMIASIKKTVIGINGLLNNSNRYQTILLFIFGFVVLFGGIGFIIAMFKPDTRMFFFSSKAMTIYYTLFVLLFLLVVIKWKGLDPKSNIMIFGFVIGAIALYFINRMIQHKYNNLP